jgi:hypothetical protein
MVAKPQINWNLRGYIMLPYSFIGTGTYVNPASIVAVNVPVTDQPDWFFVKDLTNWGAQSTAASPVYAEWMSGMAQGAYLAMSQPSSTGSGVTLYSSAGTSGGFTFIDPANPPTYAALVGTTVNKTTLVVSMSNTGSIAVGDTVRLLNPVGMLEANGFSAQVTAVSVNSSITLGYLASAVSSGLSFASNASACSILKYIPSQFYPKALQVAYITQASQAVVYFARPNDFTPGQLVDFMIPTAYGMVQLSNMTALPGGPARVLSVTNSSTTSSITINVNTTGYTAFIYPTSATYTTMASPPVCVPAGSGIVPNSSGSATIPQSPPGTNLVDAFDNRRQYYMNIGTSACGVASATMQYFAFKADWTSLSNA